ESGCHHRVEEAGEQARAAAKVRPRLYRAAQSESGAQRSRQLRGYRAHYPIASATRSRASAESAKTFASSRYTPATRKPRSRPSQATKGLSPRRSSSEITPIA